MKKSAVLVSALVFVSVWVMIAAALTAAWLTNEARVIVLVMLPAAIVATLLVVYFDWRARLVRRALAEPGTHEDLEQAA